MSGSNFLLPPCPIGMIVTVTMDSITARLRAAGNFSNAVRESSAPSTSPK
jgi:hypothetical protein